MCKLSIARCGIVVAVVGCLSYVISAATHADTFTEHAAGILEKGWLPTGDAVQSAQQRHAQAVAASAKDSRADYALALVQMRRAQWDAADKSLITAAQKHPQDLYVWRAHLWLLLYQRRFDEALAKMQSLAENFAAQPSGDAKAVARQQAAAKIMGRAYAYLAGPRKGAVEDAALTANQSQLLARLSEPCRQAFAVGEGEIAAEHQRLLAEIQAQRTAVLSEGEQEQQTQREFVEQEKVRIVAEMEGLEQQAAAAKNELDTEVSRIEGYLQPIRTSYAQVQATAAPIQLRIRDLQIRINEALSRANAPAGNFSDKEDERRRQMEEDRRRRDDARREADRWRFELTREEELLRPYLIEARRLEVEAAALEQQRRAALAKYQGVVGPLNAAARKLQRTDKLLKVSERELNRPVKGSSAKGTDLKARLALWSTYEKFPLEQERQRLLKELKP